MNEERLQVAFQCVRKTFFPRWDRKNEWKIVDATDDKENDIVATCIEEAKCIIIYEIPDNDDHLHELLIHEICHIKAPGHGKKWANNMKTAQWNAFINPTVSKALEGMIDYDIMKLFDERLI